MSLIQQTNAQRIAAQIDSINGESISFLRAQMQRAYSLANTAGEQQAILDVFGENATQAIGIYATLRTALNTLGQAEGLPDADFSIFQPQPDGSVLYVAPPTPEPELVIDPQPAI
jgi:hypothetical protein